MTVWSREENLARWRAERGAGQLTLSARPLELQIEATNRCLHACGTCARNYYDRAANPAGDLIPAMLDAIAPHFAQAESVLVGGYGEPLLAEITFDILARARQAGCRTTIITGGGELDEDRARRLVDAGLNELLLSVDGEVDESNYARRQVLLSDVLANMRRLRRLDGRLVVTFNITLQRDNLDELPRIMAVAAGEGVPRVRAVHQKIYSRAQADHSLLADPIRAEGVFAEARSIAQATDIALELPPLGGTKPCEQPYRMLVVRHDGVVQGCCSALFESPLPRVLLGRLPDDDLDALWNAPAMQDARRWTLGEGPADAPCVNCAFRVFTVAAHQRFLDGPVHV